MAATAFVLGACAGPQSVLDPAGTDAAKMTSLFWIMLAGAVVLWLLVNGLMFYATRINPRPLSRRAAESLVIGGGIVFPTVVLAGLLTYALADMDEQRAPGTGLTVRITGEQWWWRIEYWPDGADAPVVSANELVLPAGSRSELKLNADKVIHSFWVPAFGGKTDMIPGRETRMSLEPLKPGLYRGQCTEFCGLSHAQMAFAAIALPPQEFSDWLAAESAPAKPPADELAMRGQAVFLGEGCGACHSVRGTAADGTVGPDLTHLGGRTTLAAGVLPMTRDALARFIADPEAVKPGAKMPAYDHLSGRQLAALAAYLEGLR